MLEDELFADFKLLTNDGKTLKAHRSILAARSPMFYAMLSTDMQESQQGSTDVPDFDSTTMKEVLRFIYSNKVDNFDDPVLVFAAEKYQLEELKQLCIENLQKTLSVKNVVESLVISDKISNAKKLYEKCLDVVNK